MNFMIKYTLIIKEMQVVQVEDKVGHIMHGGYIIIYKQIILIMFILKIQIMEALALQIFALWHKAFQTKKLLHIILVNATKKEMEDIY